MNVTLPKNINLGLPPEIKSSRNFLLEIVLLVVVCILFFWFIILPKKAQIADENGTKSKYAEDQQNMANVLKSLNAGIAGLGAHQDDIAKLDYAMPLANRVTDPQILIQKLADDSGVTVGDINLTAANNSTEPAAGDAELLKNPYGATRTLQKISGSVYVIGPFLQDINFLKKIETSGRVFQVTGLEISGAQNNSLNLKITMDVYYLAP